MGIQLPSRLFSSEETAQTEIADASDSSAADSSASDSAVSAAVSSASDAADASAAESGTAASSESAAAASAGAASASSDTASASSDSGSLVTFSGAQLKDGTYEGSAEGYKSTITVSVTVSGGKVTDISVVSEGDTDQFFSRAEAVLDDILGQQSLEVDTVTGATFSSAGLINAVSDALQSAVVSGTLQVTNIDLSSVSRHGR